MAEPKDNTSFFRKVVKFVANPTTEWAEIGTPADELRETEFAKSELKAMIERKRRNDFVRKREFDMLRKVRREGLTSEQLAALGGSSKLDDSEGNRMQDAAARPDAGVKQKIDEIEQQMVGETLPGALKATPAPPQPRGPEFYNATTEPMPMRRPNAASDAGQPNARAGTTAPATAPVAAGAAVKLNNASPDFDNPFAVEVSEVQHDPELDEAVISFANADFDQCEASLSSLVAAGGSRAGHAETWLVLFDLYRAIGQQHKFESLALDYAQAFGWSAPQWFSMPRLVAEAAEAAEIASPNRPARARSDGQVGWICPEYLDADSVAKLASVTLQMPLPWVFDWSSLKGLDAESAAKLSELFRHWMPQKLDMRWLGGERLFTVLSENSPTGVRDVDPAFWQLRLDALRMANRPDQFDEAAIDYCVTYEVSPPSWERAVCEARVSSGGASTSSPPLSVVSEVSTSFVESTLGNESASVQVAAMELSGQLVGDIGETLKRLEDELRAATFVNVSCARLIRVDFIAAGDLLNWVLARRSENRTVSFVDAHRLVALFFGAMGISEHAKVKVRTV